MSGQIKLKAASLGGDITLAPTDTASNLVVTIPAVTATLLNNLSDIEAQVKTATSATGSAPIFSCRAWVNFNGTGTVAIRESGNVSSITDNGTGLFTVNFTTAMPDLDYCVTGSVVGSVTDGFNNYVCGSGAALQLGNCPIKTFQNAGVFDAHTTSVAIFR